MACFVVPMAEAIVITVMKKIVEKKEQKVEIAGALQTKSSSISQAGISWSRKLGWLNKLLWGGALLLVIEHIWHGEVVLWPPFLTAMNNPADIAPMLHEIATVGTSMALFVTTVWAIMVVIADHKAKALFAKVELEA